MLVASSELVPTVDVSGYLVQLGVALVDRGQFGQEEDLGVAHVVVEMEKGSRGKVGIVTGVYARS